jgi:hypothetical protein
MLALPAPAGAATLTCLLVPVSWDSLNGLKGNVERIAGGRSVTLTRGYGPMRIFSLATDEAVAIGDDIVVKVLEINGDEVQLGIEHSDGVIPEFGGAVEEIEFESVP